ncbi:urocanate hydratase [Leucobacter sp. CSA2]|uniref:Urocanate hydratase n=1 Tax=Leucobacter edaphi TaxID=2796472 RepID=A0A934QD12_9MICO|nr:urocanate hydratase [Leucobacter edaphi]MBK0421570.1 urocanate hydratase [Leucobacter edaphi]
MLASSPSENPAPSGLRGHSADSTPRDPEQAASQPPVSPILARGSEPIAAARGATLRARNWRAEALLRMFENVLEVGERPQDLIVYASLGKAARNWDEACAIAQALLALEENETLVLQSGAAIGVLPMHADAPLVVSAVNNTVGRWATPERFYERAGNGQTIWGGLTAAAWQYIGRQGVLQGTYELLRVIARRHLGGERPEDLRGRWLLTAGLGGMGSAQPISAKMLGLSSITVEVDPARAGRAFAAGAIDLLTGDRDWAFAELRRAQEEDRVIAIGLVGNAADVFSSCLPRGLTPDVVSDQTAAHDPRYGYVPVGYTIDEWVAARESDPESIERAARASITWQVEAMLELQSRGSIVFENGNNLRVQAIEHLGEADAPRINAIPGFMEAYLRPLFARGIGPFRWVCLSGSEKDLRVIDELASRLFPDRPEVARWIELARAHVPPQGLPARSCWLGHGERSRIAGAVNALVADGTLSAPVLFTRDHLDSAGMTHPRIGSERMRDGSDGVTDWPLLDAMLLAAGGADLVAVHSGGGGYSGWMQSAGVSVVADGSAGAARRITRTLDSDTGLGVLRHATAGYPEAIETLAAAGPAGTTGAAKATETARLAHEPDPTERSTNRA